MQSMSLEHQLQITRSDLTHLESRILDLKNSIMHNQQESIPEEQKKSLTIKLHHLQEYLKYIELESRSVLGKRICTMDSFRSCIYYTKIDNKIACVTRIDSKRFISHSGGILANLKLDQRVELYDAVRHQSFKAHISDIRETILFFEVECIVSSNSFEMGEPCLGEKMIQVGVVEIDGTPTASLSESYFLTNNATSKGIVPGMIGFSGCVGGGCFSRDFKICYGLYLGRHEKEDYGQYLSSSFF
jgi:hypothetical protein